MNIGHILLGILVILSNLQAAKPPVASAPAPAAANTQGPVYIQPTSGDKNYLGVDKTGRVIVSPKAFAWGQEGSGKDRYFFCVKGETKYYLSGSGSTKQVSLSSSKGNNEWWAVDATKKTITNVSPALMLASDGSKVMLDGIHNTWAIVNISQAVSDWSAQ